MNNKQKAVGLGLFGVALLSLAVWYLHGRNFEVLNPAGAVASQEKHLMVVALLLSGIVIIPVFILLFGFAWKYRETNKKPQTYTPDNDGNRLLETIWWLVPTALLAVLSVVIWQSSHSLDPYKALAADAKPINVQVVALDWKWLFIYPDENIASVNYLAIPVNTPINFTITADAPMNSLWIPQLGGQVYAMSGMSTQLHLVADKAGDYNGSSANISGKGFSGMRFKTHATSDMAYTQWVDSVRNGSPKLDMAAYKKLAQPSENNAPAMYALADSNLYDTILMKYMGPDMHMGHTTEGGE